MIAARPNKKRKTRSATIRPGPAASVGPHTEHDTEDSRGSGRPIPGQTRTGRHDRLPAKGHDRRLHSHGSRGAHLPKDGGPPQDEPGPRHEDRAAQDTLKEHHMARLRHDPRAVPAGGPHEDHRWRHGDRLVGRGQHRLLQQQVRSVVQHPPRPGQAQARLGQAAQHRRCLHQDRPRLPGHRRVHLRHHRIVADAGKDRRRRRLLLLGLGLPGQEDLRRHIRQGHGTAHPAQVQHRLQERGQPGLGRYDPNTQGRAGPVHGRVPPAQHHRGRLWINQENVWEPPQKSQARQTEPGDSNPGHLLQHRGGRTIARKKRQAHARVAHCNGCMTGAVAAAPSVGEPAHHFLDRMGFYSFGQHLKPAVCEKCHNPKNSKNTCTDATTADDCGVMSLGHSPPDELCPHHQNSAPSGASVRRFPSFKIVILAASWQSCLVGSVVAGGFSKRVA